MSLIRFVISFEKLATEHSSFGRGSGQLVWKAFVFLFKEERGSEQLWEAFSFLFDGQGLGQLMLKIFLFVFKGAHDFGHLL